ncbi:unnamed protein product, partial [Pylaiella littoralis]
MEGGEQTCVEAELRKLMTAIDVEVDSQLAFVMAGLTKRDGDCEDALDRVARVVHAGTYGERVLVVVEGDEETHSFMVNLKKSQPTKYEWLLPVPGAWHLLLHASKALIGRYYAAGLESVCEVLGADDKHMFAAKNYRRSHHFLLVMYEGLWSGVVDRYLEERGTPETGLQTNEMNDKVVPWFKSQCTMNDTMRFWSGFLLNDMPAYLAIRFGVRASNFKLRAAGIRQFAPFFAGTGKNRYQRLCIEFLTQLARMPDDDMPVLGKLTSASWDKRPFASVALDEMMEMFNRVIKQSLTKVTVPYIMKLGMVVEHRKTARAQVVARFYKPTKARDAVTILVRDRHPAVKDVIPFLRSSPIFTDAGK